jgi:hypothetical protein
MNKRVLATSLILVLALMIVLVIGKTNNAPSPEPVQNPAEFAAIPKIDLDTNAAILSDNTGTFSGQVIELTIPSEVNESELILDRELLPGRAIVRESTTFLMDSLQRLQQALDQLERTAAITEQAVVASENQRSRG